MFCISDIPFTALIFRVVPGGHSMVAQETFPANTILCSSQVTVCYFSCCRKSD